MASGGPFLQTLAQARAIDWGHSWQWDCQFPAAPPPFGGWFPATEANRGISELETHSFVGFGDTHDIPFASGARSFNVTFVDDHTGTLLTWLSQWMELYTLNYGQGTERLANIVRQCLLVQGDATGNMARMWSLQVFPFGSLSFASSSESTHRRYIVSFRIAGVDNPNG